jgi:hypothetical protein
VILTLELQPGEELPSGFVHYLVGAGPHFEKRYQQTVPPIELRLVRDGKRYRAEGGFWMEEPM